MNQIIKPSDSDVIIRVSDEKDVGDVIDDSIQSTSDALAWWNFKTLLFNLEIVAFNDTYTINFWDNRVKFTSVEYRVMMLLLKYSWTQLSKDDISNKGNVGFDWISVLISKIKQKILPLGLTITDYNYSIDSLIIDTGLDKFSEDVLVIYNKLKDWEKLNYAWVDISLSDHTHIVFSFSDNWVIKTIAMDNAWKRVLIISLLLANFWNNIEKKYLADSLGLELNVLAICIKPFTNFFKKNNLPLMIGQEPKKVWITSRKEELKNIEKEPEEPVLLKEYTFWRLEIQVLSDNTISYRREQIKLSEPMYKLFAFMIEKPWIEVKLTEIRNIIWKENLSMKQLVAYIGNFRSKWIRIIDSTHNGCIFQKIR